MVVFKDTKSTVQNCNINITYVDNSRGRDLDEVRAVDSAVRQRKGEAYNTTENPRKLHEEQQVLDRMGFRCRHCLCPGCERTRRKREQDDEEREDQEEKGPIERVMNGFTDVCGKITGFFTFLGGY